MEFEFLKQFPKRMKHVGAFALLFRNSLQKQTWKQYGFETIHEQTNLIFSVMLYIMEQSLKEEVCTIDDIGYFIDGVNVMYYKKPMTYEECKILAEFIVNVILCDEGKAMYFEGYSYEDSRYEDINISFIMNKIIYIEGEAKRTSYYLTDDGYNLMLSTLEIESNLKLTIQEMIFKLHLEKASYDRAAGDMKNIFNLLRMQLQKIQEAMKKVRQNALNYSVAEYNNVLEENLSTIDQTNIKFSGYREHVRELVREMEKKDIQLEHLEEKERENLNYLKIIEGYLNRALDEYQKIFIHHLDLKALYEKELESLSSMALVSRFQLQRDFYQEILKNPASLERLDLFLRPLFVDSCEKIYHPQKAFEFQKIIRNREEDDAEDMVDIDSEEYIKEQNKQLQQKWLIYEKAIAVLLRYANATSSGVCTLSEMKEYMNEVEKEDLFPTIEIFREIMIDLIKEQHIDLIKLKNEQEEHFLEVRKQFQVGSSILELLDRESEFAHIKEVEVVRISPVRTVEFGGIVSDDGSKKTIRCSDVEIRIK